MISRLPLIVALAYLALTLLTVTKIGADEPVTNIESVRFATFNISLYGKESGEVARRLESGKDRQAKNLASVIQTVRPEVLFLNEIDYDADNKTLDLFAHKYLALDQTESVAIEFPYRHSIASNTGVDSTFDLNGDGTSAGPNDAWGYGNYPGQYAMAILSKYPIDIDAIRAFQTFRWSELPGALRPLDPTSKRPYYDDDVWSKLRLSSKNHVDAPIIIGSRRVHLLASHPTPPVFDGPADHNGCRNHDEIQFWTDYISSEPAPFLIDDTGERGGLADDELFVIVGDLNADSVRGDGRREAIINLLKSPRLIDPKPLHVLPVGATDSSVKQPRSMTTAAFGGKDGMRVDYVLPSRQMIVREASVFWPSPHDSRRKLLAASDHRLVWVEVALP